MKRLTNLFLCLSAVSVTAVTAQTMKVTGTVISAEDDSPVIGASIVVAGTTQEQSLTWMADSLWTWTRMPV